jgi:hypothetical protein
MVPSEEVLAPPSKSSARPTTRICSAVPGVGLGLTAGATALWARTQVTNGLPNATKRNKQKKAFHVVCESNCGKPTLWARSLHIGMKVNEKYYGQAIA